MMMRFLFLNFVLLSLLLSCQQKKPSQAKDQAKEKTLQESLHRQKIEKTYNYDTYLQNDFAALELLWIKAKDSIKLKIFYQPENDLKIIKKDTSFLYVSDNQFFESPSGSFKTSDLESFKHIVQAYSLPYQLSNYQIEKTTDSLQLNDETSLTRSYYLNGNNNLRLFLSPHTDLIKLIEFSDLSESTYLVYDKYITVQQIPISMRWSFYKNAVSEENAKSRVEVRKISYPDQLPVDFKVPTSAKPVLNN